MSNVIDPGLWGPKPIPPKPGVWARFEALLRERASPREVEIRRWSYSASVLLDGVEVAQGLHVYHRRWDPVSPDPKYKNTHIPHRYSRLVPLNKYGGAEPYDGVGWMGRMVDDILAWAANPIPPEVAYRVAGLVPDGGNLPLGYTVGGTYVYRRVVGEEAARAAQADLLELGIKAGRALIPFCE